MTQLDLGKALGMDAAEIASIESSYRPDMSLNFLKRLCGVLDVLPATFLHDVDPVRWRIAMELAEGSEGATCTPFLKTLA